jgi:hypothetical protein
MKQEVGRKQIGYAHYRDAVIAAEMDHAVPVHHMDVEMVKSIVRRPEPNQRDCVLAVMEVPNDIVTIAGTKDEYVIPARNHERTIAPHVIVGTRSTDQQVISALCERDLKAIADHEIKSAVRAADPAMSGTTRRWRASSRR